MSVEPLPTTLSWITPEEQLKIIEETWPDPATLPLVTKWYEALRVGRELPETVPLLSKDLYKIMTATCPIYQDQTVGGTHVLVLVSNRAVSILTCGSGKRPMPDTTCWGLVTKDVLPESRGKNWEEQVAVVDRLREKTLLPYDIAARSQGMIALSILEELGGSDENTWMRVKPSKGGRSEMTTRYGYDLDGRLRGFTHSMCSPDERSNSIGVRVYRPL